MKRKLLCLILIFFCGTLFSFAKSNMSLDQDEELRPLYQEFSGKLHGADQSKMDFRGVMREFAFSVSKFQFEELRRVNPVLNRILDFEISVKGSRGNKKKSNIRIESDMVSNKKANERKSELSEIIIRAYTKNYYGLGLEYRDSDLSGGAKYLVLENEIDVSLKDQKGPISGSVKYNITETEIKTVAGSDFAKGLYVYVSAKKNLSNDINYTGVGFKFSF